MGKFSKYQKLVSAEYTSTENINKTGNPGPSSQRWASEVYKTKYVELRKPCHRGKKINRNTQWAKLGILESSHD